MDKTRHQRHLGEGSAPTWALILSMCMCRVLWGALGEVKADVSQSRTHAFLYVSDIYMLSRLSLLIKLHRNVSHWASLDLFKAKHTQVGSCCLSFTSAISFFLCLLLCFLFLSSLDLWKIYIVSNNHILTHITVWNNLPWTTWGMLDLFC